MPRIPRGLVAGYAYHVINRGNGGAAVFHHDTDYRAFLKLLAQAKTKYPTRLLAFCLMPNHFHLIIQPSTSKSLSAMMQWWLTSHVRRYHRQHHSHGHVWQGRFKSFPIQQDAYLSTVLRYVLLNPVRAGLVSQADQWPWSSLNHPGLVDHFPVNIGSGVDLFIHVPLHDQELTRLRQSVNRQSPFGTADWQRYMARTFNLQSTLRPRGRPRKLEK